MRRFFAGTAAALLAAVLFLPVGAGAVSARRAYAVDAVSGRVLYEKNPTERSLIASTTKIMTALIVCEQCNVLDRMRIPKEAVGIEGSSMYLRAGETVRVEELLYGLLLCSGNDAALALTECAGGLTPFVALMNEKAAALGMARTSFANPNGLDADGHYSTARDMAVLAAAAVENPTLRDGNDWADHATLYDYGFRLTAPRRGVQTALLRLREPLTAACAALHS